MKLPSPASLLRGRGPSDPSPLITLFLGSTAAAILVATVGVASLAATVDVGRARDLELLRSLRLFLEDRNVNPLTAFPAVLSRPFELHEPASLLLFLALSMVVTVLVSWAVCAFAAVVVAAGIRLHRRHRSNFSVGWFWGRAYPLGVLVGFALPAIWIAARHAPHVHSRATMWVLTGATAALVWLGLLLTLRRPDRVRKFLRASCLLSVVAAMAVWGGAGVVVALAGRGPAQPAPAAGLPNILLVSIDSLRRDHVHSYGYTRETSPSIDRLAREGVAFRTVASPTSWTLPAHMTLLTALPPEAHGVVDDGMRLRHNALFLAQILWQAGYATAGFVSAPYLDAAYGFSQGFDHYDDYTVAKASQGASHKGTTSPALLGIVSRWLTDWDAHRRQRPFFIFMHMWDVHYDYTPPPPYDSMFDPDYKGTVTGENYEYGTQVHLGMDPHDLEHIIALYDGEIRFTDLYLGHVLALLQNMGVLDGTIVVVTADHGDEFFEHGNKSHSKALYDETTLVPLVIRFPRRVPQGKVVEGQVRLMDVAPTIMSLAGVSPPQEFGASAFKGAYSAQDLTRWISADSSAEPPALIAFGDLRTAYAPKPVASVRTTTSKLIRELRSPGNEEFYDLVADPGERENIVAKEAAAETPLRQELASWRDGWQGARPMSQRVQLSEEHKERLRALGYIR